MGTVESESEVTIMNDSDTSEMTTNWEKFRRVAVKNADRENSVPVIVNNQQNMFLNSSFE